MKAVIINDCAYVGETIVKFLPANVEAVHLKRSRKLWDKTFGLTWRIIRTNGDVFHVHYLLQDCYIASRLGKKPLVGHAHGSDLRNGLKHWIWSRIVRHNLKNCDWIFLSTPDLLGITKEYVEKVEYLPNPVDTHLFFPKPVEKHSGRLKVLIAGGSDWEIKGTDIAIRALSRLQDTTETSIIGYGKDLTATLALAKSLNLNLHVLPKISHANLREHFWNADVVVDQFSRYGVFGVTTLEAIACGRPTLTHASSQYDEFKDFPLKDCNNVENVVENIEKASKELWEKEYAYLNKYHSPQKIGKKLADLYSQLSKK